MFGRGIAKGMLVTLRHLFRKPITIQYPEDRPTLENEDPWRRLADRFRGYEFVWYEDRCTGCAICAKSCPQGNIEIITHVTEDNTYHKDKFEIDIGRCIFCGLCVEACPYEALYMGTSFEQARYRRHELYRSKEIFNSVEKIPSSFARPKLEAPEIEGEVS